MLKRLFVILIFCFAATCMAINGQVTVGAARTSVYLKDLQGKRVALFSNHTGIAKPGMHTLDLLRQNGINVTCLFSPEHGFRGTADAGESVNNSIDPKTNLPIVSLYGKGHAAAMNKALDSVDVIVVDIQDVGTRFYTYYCTMLELMDAAAQKRKIFMVLDRPNPIGMMIDGPVLDMKYASGVGRLPIPVAHGLTLGEMAMMANEERWLPSKQKARLFVVTCDGYTHSTRYKLPVPPSPNLRTMKAIYLYPSLCYFEATDVSIGRGTDSPFTIYGHPEMKGRDFSFIPKSMPGATNPPQIDQECFGKDLSSLSDDYILSHGVDLSYVIDAYRDLKTENFFSPFFEKLIGNAKVRQMILKGSSAAQIKASWQPELEKYKELRQKYLLYPE